MRISGNSQLSSEQAKIFGREVRKRRNEMGFSAKDFATLVDCSVSYLCNIELGNKRPSPQLADCIAKTFGVEVSDMLDPTLSESKEERVEYGKKLFARRMDKKLNRSVVAGALGIPVEVYREFESGECSISPHQKKLLNELLGIDKDSETAPATVVKELVGVPTDICDIILNHVKDLQIDSEAQKKVWRYFTEMKISAQERELFG